MRKMIESLGWKILLSRKVKKWEKWFRFLKPMYLTLEGSNSKIGGDVAIGKPGIALLLLVHATYAGPGKALGKPGNCPGPRAFGVLALGYQNTPLVFHSFRLFTMRQNCRAFWLLRLVYRSRKLITLAFIVFEWLKRIKSNSTTLCITQGFDRNQSTHGHTQIFF